MERKTPMRDRLKAFVVEMSAKKEKLTHTIEDFDSQCAQELELLNRKVQELSAKLLLAESENSTENVKKYEVQIKNVREQLMALQKKGERYKGVEQEQLFANDLPMLKQYALACRNERQGILADITRMMEEKNQQIQELQMEIRMLNEEMAFYPAHFEESCVAPIAAYMPGGDRLIPYAPGNHDYGRICQIGNMLFE